MDLQGLQRTDNNLDLTIWPQVNMINQKNYYTYVLFVHPRCDSCPLDLIAMAERSLRPLRST